MIFIEDTQPKFHMEPEDDGFQKESPNLYVKLLPKCCRFPRPGEEVTIEYIGAPRGQRLDGCMICSCLSLVIGETCDL